MTQKTSAQPLVGEREAFERVEQIMKLADEHAASHATHTNRVRDGLSAYDLEQSRKLSNETRSALHAAISRLSREHADIKRVVNGYPALFKAVLAAAPAVGVPPWIPAAEQLPDVDGRYLVHSQLGIPARDWVDVMYYATSPIGEWSRRHGETVKHWMPLPALPGQAEALQSDEQKERMGVPLSDERAALQSILNETEREMRELGVWDHRLLGVPAGGVQKLIEDLRAVLAASLEKK